MAQQRKTALVTGITGQDGAYLAKLLLERDYRVVGVSRDVSPARRTGLQYLAIDGKFELRACDLGQLREVVDLVDSTSPDEIYNLAAASSVANSFFDPQRVVEFNSTSVLNLLEAVRTVRPTARFYQASSSEMFAGSPYRPITPDHRPCPLSPYGASKAAGHHLTEVYRDCYGLFAVSGVLFNHESVLRPETYFVKKVVRSAIRIRAGLQDVITLGNLDIRRDFGLAERYVEAVWLMLQQEAPRNYVVCSGKSVQLREIVDHVAARLGLGPEVIRVRQGSLRPTDALDIYGDPTATREELGWNYDLHPLQAIDCLIDEELRQPSER